MDAPSQNLLDLNNLLLRAWCQIPQHTFRSLVEFVPQWVMVGGHVMADQCMSQLESMIVLSQWKIHWDNTIIWL